MPTIARFLSRILRCSLPCRGQRLGVALAAGLILGVTGFVPRSIAEDLPLDPGGFLETATTAVARPRPASAILQTILPGRGPFTFPLPYGTRAVRLTNGGDCGGGDCVDAVGYSYWRVVNNHVGSDTMLIVLGLNRARGGSGPTLFRYDKTTDQVTNLGPLFDPAGGRSWHSTEGWYFSGTQPTRLYLDDGPRMLRYDVLTRQSETVFDVTPQFGAGRIIWQMHSSDDDRVHSATLRSSVTWEMLGCVVYHEDQDRFQYFPRTGEFNECHIDKSGRQLMILEDIDGRYDLEMRIIDLATGSERLVWDQDGAVGHADMGHGYVLGSDNWNNLPNAVRLWEFARDPLAGSLVSHNLDWSAPAPNHIAHGNARADVPPDRQYACGSGATRANAVWGNEIICFRLDGSLDVLVVAPVMTDLDAPGGGGDDYVKMPKGSLDVTGRYFLWTSNAGGNRLDAFLVKVPGRLLLPGAADTTAPSISAVLAAGVSSTGATIGWTTNEAADTQVEYGPTIAYGAGTPLDPAPATVHAVAVSGLSPATTYHYRVKSRDAAGNLAVSGDFTFQTAPAPAPLPAPGPIGSWSLREGAGSTAGDTTGNGHHGTLVGGPAWIAGVSGSGLAFDGADDFVDVPHQPALDPYPITVAAWIRTTATGLHGVVNKYLPASFNGYQIFLNGGNLCAWYFRDTANHVWDGTSCTLATPGFADGRWHHVAFVVDAAGGRLYVDGVETAVRAWTGTPGAATTTAPLAFGRYPAIATPYLRGDLDDIRIHARALSGTEVADLLHVDAAAPVLLGIVVSGLSTTGATVAWTSDEPADTQVEYGPTIAYGAATTLDPGLVTAHLQALAGLTAGTQYHYRVKSRDAAGNLAVSGDFTFTTTAAAPPTGDDRGKSRLLGLWTFSPPDGAIAYDSSGNGSHGALVGGPAWIAGVSGSGLAFDGADDFVDVPHQPALDPYPITVAAWIRTTATGLHGVVNKYLPASFNGYQIFLNGGSLCAWYFRDTANHVWDGTSCTLATPGFADGRWHHVAFVVDAGGGRLYVDGVETAARAWTGTPGAATTTAPLAFGRYPAIATPYLRGDLDDIRIHARALEETEVRTLAATEGAGI